jgi:hypothetical protein
VCRIGVSVAATMQTRTADPSSRPDRLNTYSCCTFTVGDGVEFVGDFTLIRRRSITCPPRASRSTSSGTYVENVLINALKNVTSKCGARTRIVSNRPTTTAWLAVFHIISSEA